MILLDPDLDAHPAALSPKAATSPESRKVERDARLPSVRTLTAFLRKAQTAVRLKGIVSVLLTTDKAIRTLNRDFRGKNKATDVLSFPAAKIPHGDVAGDLAISIDTAREQAREQGHSLGIEIKVLMLHGLLHLAGHDHETDNGKMARREHLLRAKLALPLGLIERTAPGAATRPRQKSREAAGARPKSIALKGHGISRAGKRLMKARALAPEGRNSAVSPLPQNPHIRRGRTA